MNFITFKTAVEFIAYRDEHIIGLVDIKSYLGPGYKAIPISRRVTLKLLLLNRNDASLYFPNRMIRYLENR